MKISYNWLKEYLVADVSVSQICDILTNIGLEVEGIEEYYSSGLDYKNIVVGEILDIRRLSEDSNLLLLKVNIGSYVIDVISGANGLEVGKKVATALEGAEVYIGSEKRRIEKKKIRNVFSEGMICSEFELALSNNYQKIVEFNDNVKPGTPIVETINIYKDFVIEINVTPNRADALSHFGIARDLYSYLKIRSDVKIIKPQIDNFSFDLYDPIMKIEIKNTEACNRYTGLVIKDVKVCESPEWLKNYLKALGFKPINNIVDASNFVMLELGHPIHIFDLDTINDNNVVIDFANESLSFTTLDGIERKISSEDILIKNNNKPLCIAGIYGGLNSGVSENTKNIFIEVANFNSKYIRKTSKRLNLVTESSYRFERGVNQKDNIFVIKRVANLIKDLAGGLICWPIYDLNPLPKKRTIITTSYEFINNFIGYKINSEIIEEILNSLEIKILNKINDNLVLEIPDHRLDIFTPVDIVEEILRIYGYNEIPTSDYFFIKLVNKQDYNIDYKNFVSNLLSNNGFFEIITSSLTKKVYIDSFFNEIKDFYPIELLNPLSSDLQVLRPTLLFTMLEIVKRNLLYQNFDLKFYEFGKVYYKKSSNKIDNLENYNEIEKLCLLITGNEVNKNWIINEKKFDFWNIKYYVELVLNKLNITYKDVINFSDNFFDYGLMIKKDDKVVVKYGKISYNVLKFFEIEQNVYFAEFDWEVILSLITKNKVIEVTDLVNFPIVRRDLSIIIDKNVQFIDLEKLAYNVIGKCLKKVILYDYYVHPSFGEEKKSYCLSFYFQSENKTLTDAEINDFVNKLIEAYKNKFNVIVRA